MASTDTTKLDDLDTLQQAVEWAETYVCNEQNTTGKTVSLSLSVFLCVLIDWSFKTKIQRSEPKDKRPPLEMQDVLQNQVSHVEAFSPKSRYQIDIKHTYTA